MPQDLITYLPNGQAVCRDHRLRICPVCCLDLTYDDSDSLDEGDDGGNEDDHEEEDEDPEAVAQMRAVPPYLLLAWQDRCFILAGSTARFIPQWEESLVGGDDLTRLDRLDKDYNNPPIPNQPSSLSLHYCTTCHLTWVGGRAGLAGLENHPSHHTLYHQYSGTSRSLMVFVDGACASNGTSNARGGIGVYFGPNSPFNQSVPLVLQPGERATSQKAEIHAVITALRQVRSRIMPDRQCVRLLPLALLRFVMQGASKLSSPQIRAILWRQCAGITLDGSLTRTRENFETSVGRSLRVRMDFDRSNGRWKYWHGWGFRSSITKCPEHKTSRPTPWPEEPLEGLLGHHSRCVAT